METLTGSSSRLCSGRNSELNFLSPREVLGRPDILFLSSPKHVSVGFSNSISLQHKRIQPIFVSCLSSSSETQKHLLNEETEIQETSKIAHVKFQLQKECAFGEQFHVVGDDPMLGSWDPLSAIPLDWSEGHIWTVELDIPIGKSILFKFILKGNTGEFLWQPGPDRILQTWETNKTISVSEDWDNAELQMIIETEPCVNENVESTINSEMVIIAENLTERSVGLTADVDKDSATINTITTPVVKPLPEKSMAIVAENIADPVEKPQVHTNNKGYGARTVAYAKEEPSHVSNKDRATGKSTLGNNDRAVTLKDLAGTKEEGTLVSYEGDPVLLPGLAPLTTVDAEETSPSGVNNDIAANALPGADKSNELSVPELDLKKVPKNDSPHPKESTEMVFNEVELHGNQQEENPDLAEEQDPKESTEMVFNEEELHGNQQEENPDLAEEQDQDNSKLFDNALENDIKWGRRTLQKLLTIIGFH